ncbi:DegT/DnrJ/EryC1/StrS family aminotransferase [Streptomyces humi]|uniref:DegT/DnrJ/EryC1/StrS family aminotransferase n=1 Tax=Streptomyces humi TaxID=1428620 RepID=UPI00069B882F|nr:DegT/DnrJ/EryC1/StrS family aminotransferase [Streptomyces humi]
MIDPSRQIVLGNDVQQQYAELKHELDAAMSRVIADGRLVLGPAVQEFERDFAAFCGTPYALGVGTCTDALFMALTALGVGRGDEVITSPVTFVATVSAIVRTGATPVFADIDPASFTLDASAVADAYTERTRAIVPVHLFGLTADMDPLLEDARRVGAAVVEDAAQAVGAAYWGRPAGSFGDAAVFSFFPTKNLGCYGDGGAVVTGDPALHARIGRLREHGFEPDGYVAVEEGGINSRLDCVQAAVLSVKMRTLRQDIARRIAVAARYDELLRDTGIRTPEVPVGRTHAFHQYTVTVPGGPEHRDETLAYLRKNGVDARVFYGRLVPHQPAMAAYAGAPGRWPAAERYADHALSLPCHPRLTADQQSYVCALLKRRY